MNIKSIIKEEIKKIKLKESKIAEFYMSVINQYLKAINFSEKHKILNQIVTMLDLKNQYNELKDILDTAVKKKENPEDVMEKVLDLSDENSNSKMVKEVTFSGQALFSNIRNLETQLEDAQMKASKTWNKYVEIENAAQTKIREYEEELKNIQSEQENDPDVLDNPYDGSNPTVIEYGKKMEVLEEKLNKLYKKIEEARSIYNSTKDTVIQIRTKLANARELAKQTIKQNR